MKFIAGLIGICLLASSCSVNVPDILPPSTSVTRQEVEMTSNAYSEMAWKPGRKNILHGLDPSGIRVDTPDRKKGDHTTEFWTPGEWTRGMAYKWGGFDTPKEFMVKINSSYHPDLVRNPAGDIATPEKVKQGDDAVSPYVAGIDCSGFISRCWRLGKPYSTRELPSLCKRLPSCSDLRKGDILILPGTHVTLFLEWVDKDRTRFIGSEAGGTKYWRVIRRNYPLDMFVEQGFVPMRYRNIR